MTNALEATVCPALIPHLLLLIILILVYPLP